MKWYLVDSFTKEAFSRKPVVICFPEQEIGEEKILKITQEFVLSETVFIHKNGKGVESFLAKYLAGRLYRKIMNAYQASFRTGYMQLTLQADKV